ncbi:MAG: hypothetical protein ACK5Q2_09685, partial [Bacteroidota bacterium]
MTISEAMEKIPAKQIDGVVDLVTEQQVTARKQFDDGVGASNGTSTHYPILKGGYLYWVVSPGGNPQNGDYRLGVGSSGTLAFEIRQNNAWAPYCPPGCVAAPSGCLLHGTQILMADGSNKAVEDIQVGDLVTSVALTGLDSQNENGWQTYQTSFFGPSPNTASVVGVLNAQFDDGVGASNGTSTHYPILKGGYLYWVVSPGGNPQNGDYRLGVGSSGTLAFEIRQNNAWAPYCPPGCVAAPSGCLLHGTQILMADGSNKAVEDIQVGDLVTSVALTGLDSQNENGWQTYQTSFFGPSPNTASVVGVLNAQFDAYYVINNKLRITFEHPVLIKRNQQYQFSRVQDLVIGDELFHFTNGWTALDTFELVN